MWGGPQASGSSCSSLPCKVCSPSTLAVYNSAQRTFSAFCHQLGIMTLYPVNERLVCRFMAQLAEEHLEHHRNKIRHGLGDPFQLRSMPVLEYGSRLERVSPPRPRLPITPVVLMILKTAWPQKGDPDGIMLWAATCTGIFWILESRRIYITGIKLRPGSPPRPQ